MEQLAWTMKNGVRACTWRLLEAMGEASARAIGPEAVEATVRYLGTSKMDGLIHHAACVRRREVLELGDSLRNLERHHGGQPAAAHTWILAVSLKDKDAEVQLAALATLGEMGEAASEHAGAVAARVEDEDKAVRRAAVRALGTMGGAHVSLVADRLKSVCWTVRLVAAQALGTIGEAGEPYAGLAVARLADKDEDERVQRAVVTTLFKFHPKALLPHCQHLTGQLKNRVRVWQSTIAAWVVAQKPHHLNTDILRRVANQL